MFLEISEMSFLWLVRVADREVFHSSYAMPCSSKASCSFPTQVNLCEISRWQLLCQQGFDLSDTHSAVGEHKQRKEEDFALLCYQFESS